jgi:hypothetical protein
MGLYTGDNGDFTGDKEEKDDFIIRGTHGYLRMVSMGAAARISVHVAGEMVDEHNFATPAHTAQEMIQAVTDQLRGLSSADCISRADNAVRASTVLENILGTYYGDCAIDFWDKAETWPGRPTEKARTDMLALVHRCGYNLKHATKAQRADKEIVRAACFVFVLVLEQRNPYRNGG